jgi:hypothetical protein
VQSGCSGSKGTSWLQTRVEHTRQCFLSMVGTPTLKYSLPGYLLERRIGDFEDMFWFQCEHVYDSDNGVVGENTSESEGSMCNNVGSDDGDSIGDNELHHEERQHRGYWPMNWLFLVLEWLVRY